MAMPDWWVDRPWRMIQTNMREIDMLDIDAGRFVAALQAFEANVVLVNAAGIIASYPTRLPFHCQSLFLKGDSLKQIIDACHAVDIKFLARTDFSKVRRPIYEAHPEWAYRSPEGAIIDYNGDVHVCINGAYQQEYMFRIIEELISTHDVDGIFFNMSGYQVRDYSGTYYGICHCDNCQARFRERYGLALPKVEDTDDPVYRAYTQFKRETQREHQARVYRFVQELRPNLCMANHLEYRRGVIRQESNTALERPLPHWQYSASDNTKWAVSNYPEMVSSNTTVDFIDFPYRHVAVSPEQQRLRLAQNLANGGALDYYLIGRLDNHEDRSGYEGIQALYHYQAAHEDAYRGLGSLANIALLNGPDANHAEFRGWFRFLVENHYLFDTLLADVASSLSWSRYQAIILPDYQPVGDALAERLDRYVADGGIVIAIARAAFRDEKNEPRAFPALHCLGLVPLSDSQPYVVRSDMRSSYLKVDERGPFAHLPETDLVFMESDYVHIGRAPGVHTYLRLVPPQPYGPPERCYYAQVTDHPGVTVNSYGRGKAIYVPWNPGALYHRQGYSNTAAFAADVLHGIAGLAPLGGNLSPMVEVTLFAKHGSNAQLLHLVNGSGHFGVSFFEPVTMHDLELILPCASAPTQVRSLVTGESYSSCFDGGNLAIHVPRLELLEAILIE
jgi:hypothetical protein